jgi:hypothetical protein
MHDPITKPSPKLSRGQFLAGTAAGALGASVYRLVDRPTGVPRRPPERVSALPAEQHVLLGVREIVDNHVEVLVPPLHHEVITFELVTGRGKGELTAAQAELENILPGLERRYEPTPAGLGVTVAGVHFVVFHPSSDDFHPARLAMDGVMPDGTKLRFPPRARGQGLNTVLHTTHRQNFLVPSRQHRSFPLAELLA